MEKSVSGWREGDPITQEHRDAVALYMSHGMGLSAEEAAKEWEEFNQLPDSAIANSLAVIIAGTEGMDAATFRRTFPTISQNVSSEAVRAFYSYALGMSGKTKAIRVRVLDDVIAAVGLAAYDIKHKFEGGKPGIGTHVAEQIIVRLIELRGAIEREQTVGLEDKDSDSPKP